MLSEILEGGSTNTSVYGTMKRTHSTQGLASRSVGSIGGFSRSNSTTSSSSPFGMSSRANSFHDLPLVAIAGLETRVSISGTTSATPQDLSEYFEAVDHQVPPARDLEAVTVEGGWTFPLCFSAMGALLSALSFGINNGNMNTQAAVMRDALGIPAHRPAGCAIEGAEGDALAANDATWGFCVSAFCLSALIGSTAAGEMADRNGRRSFLLGSSLVYVAGAALEAASYLAVCKPAEGGGGGASPCEPAPCTAAIATLLGGRLLSGIACGGSTVVVPMYLGEIAPAHLRGTLGSAFLLTAVTGMLIGQLAGLPTALGTPDDWAWILALGALPALLQLVAFQSLLVESPRWLLRRGCATMAAQALARLRGCEIHDAELLDELESMGLEGLQRGGAGGAGGACCAVGKHGAGAAALFDEALREPMLFDGRGGVGALAMPSPARTGTVLESDPHDDASSTWQLLSTPSLRRPLWICVVLMGSQQLSGINNAFNYSSTFFMANGLSEDAVRARASAAAITPRAPTRPQSPDHVRTPRCPRAQVSAIAVWMNVGNVAVVLVSTVLMDRVGRRVLLLSSMAGMLCAIVMLTVALVGGCVPLVCAATVLYVMSFGLGFGPVVWLLPAELFPMSKRAPASAAVTSVNWLSNYAVAQAFPLLASALGPLSFVPFSLVLVAALIFARDAVPETRGRTLEQIERMMRERSGAPVRWRAK